MLYATKYALTIRLTHLQVDTFPAGPALGAGFSHANCVTLPQRPEITVRDEAYVGGVPKPSQWGPRVGTPHSLVSGPSTPVRIVTTGRAGQPTAEIDDKPGETMCYTIGAACCEWNKAVVRTCFHSQTCSTTCLQCSLMRLLCCVQS